MQNLSSVAVFIVVLAVAVGLAQPAQAETLNECLDYWEGYVLKKCVKKKAPDVAECLEKVDKKFTKCLKRAEDIDKKTRKKLVKCMEKRELNRDEFKDLAKSKRKKAVAKFMKWTNKCKAKYIE